MLCVLMGKSREAIVLDCCGRYKHCVFEVDRNSAQMPYQTVAVDGLDYQFGVCMYI